MSDLLELAVWKYTTVFSNNSWPKAKKNADNFLTSGLEVKKLVRPTISWKEQRYAFQATKEVSVLSWHWWPTVFTTFGYNRAS